jgi:ribosomal protein RSM22 (predicted rRNA methylase)
MNLPPALRQAIDDLLEGVSGPDLAKASEVLSQRYREEQRNDSFHLRDDLFAKAYIASRLPATFGAIKASFEAVKDIRSSFQPKTQLDVGAGPGSALWAAILVWESLELVQLLEGSPAIAKVGEKLAASLSLKTLWQTADLRGSLPGLAPHDLVTMAYVLNELEVNKREGVLTYLWSLTKDVLIIIEPGTTAGWQRLLAARTQLFALGAHILAPCAHSLKCPVEMPDWCHFSQRVSRSRLHKQAKGAELGYEDEKYIFLAVSRFPAILPEARILATPNSRSGLVQLKLCNQRGELEMRSVSKREGNIFKKLKRLGWGDVLSRD